MPQLSPAEAVAALEEAIVLVKQLSGGGPPVTSRGLYYRVERIEPAPVAPPPVWTGSVGPKSLAVTGRVADGWLPGPAADRLSERYRTSRPIIDEAAVAVGRDPAARSLGHWANEIAPAVREAAAAGDVRGGYVRS